MVQCVRQNNTYLKSIVKTSVPMSISVKTKKEAARGEYFCDPFLAIVSLQGNIGYVPYSLGVPRRNAAVSVIARGSYGAHFFDHLAADGAGLTLSLIHI